MAKTPMRRKGDRLLWASRALKSTPAMALVPGACLIAFWALGENGLIAMAVVLPLYCWVASHYDLTPGGKAAAKDRLTSHVLEQRETLEIELDAAMHSYVSGHLNTACFVIEIDDFETIKRKHGAAVGQLLLQIIGQRLAVTLRSGDIIARISPSGLGVCTKSLRRFDVESTAQIAKRIQGAVQRPATIKGTAVEVCCSIGICLASRAPIETGKGILDGASRAATEAQRQGRGNIRDYTNALGGVIVHPELAEDVAEAFEKGQIIAYFQPQICAHTRRVTGVEALARWQHPEHGLVPALEFLHAVRQAGMWDSLTDQMIDQSLQLVVAADKAGLDLPQIGVNFAQDDLEHMRIVDRIAWALDRYDLPPKRLAVEVLESVLSKEADDAIANNIAGIQALGCDIDLDDFGTGHAAISTLRQIPAKRIKVDRSFVIKIDQDSEQQQMMATILLMAERMGLDTLAEGIENEAELAILRDLGCNHIQGYGIGKPMPFDAVLTWLAEHRVETPGNVTPIAKSA